jgi:hypothetical protein
MIHYKWFQNLTDNNQELSHSIKDLSNEGKDYSRN